MGFLDSFFDKEKTSQITITNPREIFSGILKQSSGATFTRDLKYNIFYQVIGFKGVMDGVGVSTIVANTAVALAQLGLTVCVIDTSILNPTQDVLLKTNFENYDMKDRLDWFDMPYTKRSVLHVSGIDKNISVLSFGGKNRTIVDMLGTGDNESLVDLALTELHNKFDIILLDICDEKTNVSTACLQQSQKIIQIWNDSPQIIRNIEGFLTNCMTVACPIDKMKNVVFSKLAKNTMGANLQAICDEFKLNNLAHSYNSEEIYYQLVLNRVIYNTESKNEDISIFVDMIIVIVSHICNIDLTGDKDKKKKSAPKGTITSQDIMDGKVEGTVTKKMKDRAEKQGYGTSVKVNSVDEMDDLLNK